MSEDTTTTTTTTAATDEPTTEGTTATKVAMEQTSESFTQADVDRIVNERIKRERGKFSDYDDLKAKASKLAEFEDSQKTEQQKLADKAAAAEAKAATTEAELARVKAAVKHGLTEDDLELLGTHGTPEEIDARAERLAARIKAAEANKPLTDFGGGDKGEDVGAKPGNVAELDTQIAAATTAGNFQQAIALRQERSALIAKEKKS